MAFLERLRAGVEKLKLEAQTQTKSKGQIQLAGAWHHTITRLHGRSSPSGEEWITAREVFDALGVPEPARASVARKVAALMRGEGWRCSIVGPRHLRQRGYLRDTRVLQQTR